MKVPLEVCAVRLHNATYWSMKRIFPKVSTASEFSQIGDYERSIVLCGEHDEIEWRRLLWEMRINLAILSPFLLIGLENTEHFRRRATNLAFRDLPYQYGYISEPINLHTLIACFTEMQPVTETDLDLHAEFLTHLAIVSIYGHHICNLLRNSGFSQKRVCVEMYHDIIHLLQAKRVSEKTVAAIEAEIRLIEDEKDLPKRISFALRLSTREANG